MLHRSDAVTTIPLSGERGLNRSTRSIASRRHVAVVAEEDGFLEPLESLIPVPHRRVLEAALATRQPSSSVRGRLPYGWSVKPVNACRVMPLTAGGNQLVRSERSFTWWPSYFPTSPRYSPRNQHLSWHRVSQAPLDRNRPFSIGPVWIAGRDTETPWSRRRAHPPAPVLTAAVSPRWTAQNPPLIDTSNPAISRATETRGVLLRGLLRTQVGVDLGAPAPWSALEDVGVM